MRAVYDNADGFGDLWSLVFEVEDKSTCEDLLSEALKPSRAAVEAPSCMLVDDLLEMHPNAKVIQLTPESPTQIST